MSPPAISSLAACSSVEGRGRERERREEREGGREEREGGREKGEGGREKGGRREGERRERRERRERSARKRKKKRVVECGGRSKRKNNTHWTKHNVPLPTPSEYRQPCINDNFMAKVCPLFHSVVSVYSFSKDSTNRASSNNRLTMALHTYYICSFYFTTSPALLQDTQRPELVYSYPPLFTSVSLTDTQAPKQ